MEFNNKFFCLVSCDGAGYCAMDDISGGKSNTPMLRCEQIETLLNIFRNHSIEYNAFFLEDMIPVYQTLSNLQHRVTSKQKLREYCFGGTTTVQQLIGRPVPILGQKCAASILPGKMSCFIEELREDQAEELLCTLTHPETRELIKSDLGRVLFNAVEKRDCLLVQFLCAAGPRSPSLLQSFENQEDGKKIFLQTAKGCNLEALKVFLNAVDEDIKPALLRARDSSDCTAFMYAVRLPGCLETMQAWLTEMSLETRTKLFSDCDRFGRTALWHAEAQISVFKALLQAGANPTDKDKENRTKLMDAVLSENVLIIHALLDAARSSRGRLLRMQDSEGMTALMHAARNPNVCFLEILISSCETDQDRMALVQDHDDLGRTALMFAAICNPAGVAILLAAKADPGDRDFENKTALMYAARLVGSFRSLEVIPLLLDWRKNHFAKKALLIDQGRKTLEEAIDNENLSFVQVLLSAAAEIPEVIGMLLRDPDHKGRTAIRHAIQKGNEDLIRFLDAFWKGYLLKNQNFL